MGLPRQKTVAVVGTGLTGLVTAHLLHQDVQQRYAVKVLEMVR
jgi:protoporphyrinogen oxidase